MKLRLSLRLLSAIVLAAPLLPGCAQPDPEPTAADKRLGIRPVTVQPGWRQFALDNVDGFVYAELKAQPDIRLVGDPDISASKSVESGSVMLMVMGEVDADRVTGQRYRRKYYVVWRQSGNGWDHVETHVDAGKLAPTPQDGNTGPTAKPATKPAAPATPTTP